MVDCRGEQDDGLQRELKTSMLQVSGHPRHLSRQAMCSLADLTLTGVVVVDLFEANTKEE